MLLTAKIFRTGKTRSGTTICATNLVFTVSGTSGSTSAKYFIYRLLFYLALVEPLVPLTGAIFRSGTTTCATTSVFLVIVTSCKISAGCVHK